MATAQSDSPYAVKKQKLEQHIKKMNGEAFSLLKDTSNLFRHRQKNNNQIDGRHFNQVIAVDTNALTADVEGMITYEDLVNETLKHDCLPTVVPELKSITIGGALSGIGIESSSFRYGLVHETILEFDALLANGRVVTCSFENEHRDLFYAFPNSYGTLGYAIRIKVKLIPAKKLIKLNYQHFKNDTDFFSAIENSCHKNQADYIDGVIFSPKEQVLITANFTDQAHKLNDYTSSQIFYQSIRNKDCDYLTTKDYIWRWDTDWFWCSKVFYMQNPVIRFLFGKWMLGSVKYSKIMRWANKNKLLKLFNKWFSTPKESVIQDVAIPIENAQNYYDFFRQKIGITPIWVCPTRLFNANVQYDLFKMKPNQLYLNFGFWDRIPSKHENGYYNKLIENKVSELGGNKSLYSSVFYTEKEFWTIYDKAQYDTVKQKYDPNNKLSSLYNKCLNKTL